MTPLRSILITAMVVSLSWLGTRAEGQATLQAAAAVNTPQPGVSPMMRGPIHEGFAAPVDIELDERDVSGIVVPRQPPQPLTEAPPEVKPGGNVVWIPGYWSWDTELQDYIWVSGIWRLPPPNQRWIPGYWASVEGGYQWVHGFWLGEDVEELTYLPRPPQAKNDTPSRPQLANDMVWIPGYWEYRPRGYEWRAGYWAKVDPNWLWTPAQYHWTPSGYVFSRGYWDHTPARRGWLFAPVSIAATTANTPGFVYKPTVVVDASQLATQLFVRPRYQFYYFGDYFQPQYEEAGFFPWFTYGVTNYDPLFAFIKWDAQRRNPTWIAQIQEDYDMRRRYPQLRPSSTLAGALSTSTALAPRIAVPLSEMLARPPIGGRAVALRSSELAAPTRLALELENLRNLREQAETQTLTQEVETSPGLSQEYTSPGSPGVESPSRGFATLRPALPAFRLPNADRNLVPRDPGAQLRPNLALPYPDPEQSPGMLATPSRTGVPLERDAPDPRPTSEFDPRPRTNPIPPGLQSAPAAIRSPSEPGINQESLKQPRGGATLSWSPRFLDVSGSPQLRSGRVSVLQPPDDPLTWPVIDDLPATNRIQKHNLPQTHAEARAAAEGDIKFDRRQSAALSTSEAINVDRLGRLEAGDRTTRMNDRFGSRERRIEDRHEFIREQRTSRNLVPEVNREGVDPRMIDR